MTDEEARGFEVWTTINHDPELLEGITVGQMNDLFEALVKVCMIPDNMRDVPVGLMIRLSKIPEMAFEEQLEHLRELLRVKTVSYAMTTFADKREGK